MLQNWLIIKRLYGLQAGQFLTQLEEFSAQRSLGLAALKNLVKTILVISFLCSVITCSSSNHMCVFP